MKTVDTNRQYKPRTLLRVALRHDVSPRTSLGDDRWVEVSAGLGRTLLARNGRRYGRTTMFLTKLNWRFDLGKGLMIGASPTAGLVNHDTVPVTFAGHDGMYSRLDRAYPLGQDLWMMSMLHEHGQSVEHTSPPLPRVYAVLPDGCEIGSLKLNSELITDCLMRVVRDEDALDLECAPESMFVQADTTSHSIMVRYANGATDTWVYPDGTAIQVPTRGCEVARGQVIAHVVPRQGWRGLQAMTPEAKQAARADVIDRFTCHDVLGQCGYDLRLLQGPTPEGTQVFLDTQAECEFLFDSSPIRLVGRVGMIHYNFLSNWYDRRLPVRRQKSAHHKRSPLTSPLMGAA